jgi:hypothetical protein
MWINFSRAFWFLARRSASFSPAIEVVLPSTGTKILL